MFTRTVFLFALLFMYAGHSLAQQSGQADSSAVAKQGIALAQRGRCTEALPTLKKATSHLTDKQLKYHSAMATARCAMSLEQTEVAVNALLLLNREFPRDPQVLYTITHFYAELAARASQELAASAPNSPESQQLEAEAFESQGNWDKAAAQYSKILEQNPNASGIHYRLGRIFLAKTPPEPDNAKKEFEQELKTDPNNACGIHVGRDGAASRAVGRGGFTFFARVETGRRLCGGIPRIGDVAEFFRQIRRCRRTAPTVCKNTAGRSGRSLPTRDCLRTHRTQT